MVVSNRCLLAADSINVKPASFACRTEYFKSSVNNRSYKIKGFIKCNTTYVIYLITCKKCNVQEVGCITNTLKVRIKWHLSDTVNSTAVNTLNGILAFCSGTWGDVSSFPFIGIEKVNQPVRGEDSRYKLLNCETWWIFNLETRNLTSLNIRQAII